MAVSGVARISERADSDRIALWPLARGLLDGGPYRQHNGTSHWRKARVRKRFTTVRGRCQPPVISAWREDGPDDEVLWAVTVGTDVMGYAKATSMGHLCAHSARKRLLGSLGLGVLGVGAVLVGRRIQRPSPPQAEPVPT